MLKTNRRAFLKYAALAVGGVTAPTGAQAVLPAVGFGWAAQFVVGMGLRRAAARAILAAPGRVRFEELVVAGAVIGAAEEAASQIVKYNVAAIWTKDAHANPFTVEVRNTAGVAQGGNVFCDVVDLLTGQVDRTLSLSYLGVPPSAPGESFRYAFTIADLPHSGVKQLVGRSDAPHLEMLPSKPVYVAADGEVRLG